MRADTSDLDAVLTVEAGALFEECEGRAIKSQVTNNTIIGPVIKRSLYDGLIEINLQYSGGTVRDAKVIHDGVRVDSVIGVSVRPTPDNPKCSIRDNELTVLSAGATDTREMIGVSSTDDTARLQGVNISGNKAHGAVDYLTRIRVPDIANNLVTINDNWAETVNTAFIGTFRVLGGTPSLQISASNNSCTNTAPLAVELSTTTVEPNHWKSNVNIPNYEAKLFAYASSDLTNITGDGTTSNVLYGTVRDDPTGSYNAGNGLWNAPATGDYSVTVQLALLGLTASHTDCRLVLSHPTGQLNTMVDLNPWAISTSGGRLVISGSAIISANEGDAIRAQLIISGGSLVVDIEAAEQSSFISIEPLF